MKHQKGSAHIIVVSILGLALTGALGFIFWQNFIDTDTSVESVQVDKQTASDTKTSSKDVEQYSSSNPGTYVKSFSHPSTWRDVEGDELCSDYNFCASPPTVTMVGDDEVHLTFTAPQSGTEATIDEAVANLYHKSGTTADNFTELDGFEARRVDFANGDASVLVSLRGGYGIIEFKNAGSTDIDMVLSSWKWS